MVNFNIGSLRKTSNNPLTRPTPPSSHTHTHTPSPTKTRPSHFPSPPLIQTIPPLTSFSPVEYSWDQQDPFARTVEGQSSIYYKSASPPLSLSPQPSHPYAYDPQCHRPPPPPSLPSQRIDRRPTTAHQALPPLVPAKDDHLTTSAQTQRAEPHFPSHASSYADVSSADSSIDDLPSTIAPVRRQSSKMRPSPLNPHATPDQSGYETGSSAPDTIPRRHRLRSRKSHYILEEMPELGESNDHVSTLRSHTPGVLTSLGMGFGNNHSTVSVGSKAKADKVLGLDPHAKLASFYLVSGLPREYPDWCLADAEATQGMHPTEDSLGVYWRPDVLGSAFSGQKTEDWMKEMTRQRKDSKTSGSAYGRSIKGIHVPDAGPDGAQKLVTKTIKYAHPRDIEVVNSSLAPSTTCHSFTFTIPKHDTLATIARTRLDSSLAPGMAATSSFQDTSILANPEETQLSVPELNVRNMSSATELGFHGVTMTVWTHADPERISALRQLKAHREKVRTHGLDSFRSNPALRLSKASTEKAQGKYRTSIPWGKSRTPSEGGDITASETEAGMSDSDLEVPRRGMKSRSSFVESLPEDMAVVFDQPGDTFWMPYSITLVSRHPIYDVMQDYLRLSWSRYKGNAQGHMTQICRLLNHETPRPGELYRLQLSHKGDENIIIEAIMPGALDFERGIVKVDFQLWPMFQALDLDHIFTCVEVALSNSGRVIFCSKNPAMLNICVSTLQYIVELRGWDGIAIPIIHARDMTFVIEDPGPYIIGMPTECRHMIAVPSEVVVVDIDLNGLTCKSPPLGVITPRPRREKAKQKIIAAFGPEYLSSPLPERYLPNFNKFLHGQEIPTFLGERVRAPSWWKHIEVITAFDRIMLNKHKKPTLIQRLTKSGMARQQAQLTVGEQLAKTMMRRRALHYVETRDDLEVKVAKINRRLQKMIQEGNEWKEQWKKLERYALELTQQAEDLKSKIDREKREAKRLSNIAAEQTKANVELEEKLKATENARAEAMRQLSDMHQNIQELEKEREEIMNVFEVQINQALEGMPGMADDDSRPSTPTDSILSSPISKTHSRLRPVTRDSNNSALSRFTVESSLSILGAAKGKPQTGSRRIKGNRPTTASTLGRESDERMDGIQGRMAALQAKLEMALHSAPGHSRSHSGSMDEADSGTEAGETDREQEQALHLDFNGAGEVETIEEEASESVLSHTPTASRRPSTTAFAQSHTEPLPALHGRRPSLEVNVLPTVTSESSPESDRAQGVREGKASLTPTEKGFGRPGLVLRIKRRDGSRSSSIASGHEGLAQGAHEKLVTEDSTFSEVLVSPSASQVSLTGSDRTTGIKVRPKSGRMSLPPAEYEVGGKDVDVEEDKMKRLSVKSNVTFGKAL